MSTRHDSRPGLTPEAAEDRRGAPVSMILLAYGDPGVLLAATVWVLLGGGAT